MAFSPSSMLVTGGAGFIGSNFIRQVLQLHEDVRIVNLDKLTYASAGQDPGSISESGNYAFVKGDINDTALIDSLFQQHQFDSVVHFAAESHVDRSIAGPEVFLQSNIHGTYSLLEASRKAWENKDTARFLHVSTDEVYGSLLPDDPAFRESDPYAPNSPYSASKAASDHLVRAWHHTYGLPVVTTNCSNNYGPYQHDEKLIPSVIRCCANGEPIPVYGDGSNIRDWLYVDDHCAGIWKALSAGQTGECYNFGGNNEQSNLDVVKTICRIMDDRRPTNAPHEKLISFVTDRPGHDWRYAVDSSKAGQELAWVAGRSFEDGLASTVDWYLEERYIG